MNGMKLSMYYVGELSVFCVGPQSLATCTLTDHRNGRITLRLNPLETGKHLLHVKFSAIHVPGSIFIRLHYTNFTKTSSHQYFCQDCIKCWPIFTLFIAVAPRRYNRSNRPMRHYCTAVARSSAAHQSDHFMLPPYVYGTLNASLQYQ